MNRIYTEGLDVQFWLDPDDHRNIWHFYYFVAKNLHGFLCNFMAISDMPEHSKLSLRMQPPCMTLGRDTLACILDSLESLINVYEEGIDVDAIMQERPSLISDFHQLMAWLPYMNERHYKLSRYEYENYEGEVWCSFEDMKHIDRTIARRIAPVMRDFSNCSQFPPAYYERMYGFNNQAPLSFCEKWRKDLAVMSNAWDWLASREVNSPANGDWEDVPAEVCHGLHLFAEYLPEMQND